MPDPINSRGGSLRPQGGQGQSSEGKESLQAIVDGDPELAELLKGGPPPIELLLERSSPGEEPKVKAGKVVGPSRPDSSPLSDAVFPWDESAPEPEPEAPPAEVSAPKPDPVPERDDEDFESKPYVCRYYWDNDPETFSSKALIFGKVSDVAILFGDIRIRYRSLAISERSVLDDHMPAIQNGNWSVEKLNDEKAIIRLAMVVTHIQDRPYGDTVQKRIHWLRKLPEELILAMHQAAIEYQVRLALRLRGVKEQLKN